VKVRERVANLVGGIADGVVGSRYVMALEKFFRKTLTGFQLRGGLRRPEGAPASASEFVDYAQH
jgi:hypothetical protein